MRSASSRATREALITVVLSLRRTTEHPDGAPGALERIRTLCEAGADPNRFIEAASATPLTEAVHLGNEQAVAILLAAGGDPNRTAMHGQAALHIAASTSLSAHCIEPLLRAGADMEGRDNSGRTPLITAAWEGAERSMRELLVRGANVQAVDKDGHTAWHATVFRRYDSMGIELLQAGCDPSLGPGLEEDRCMGLFASQVERMIRTCQSQPAADRRLGNLPGILASLLAAEASRSEWAARRLGEIAALSEPSA